MRLIFAFLMLFSLPVMALDAVEKRLYDVIYWPIMQAVVPCSSAKIPNAAKRAECEKNVASWGLRFPTDASGRVEAKECAKLHAGLLRGTYKIVDDPETDPWTSWRCLAPACTSNNQEVVAKSSVRSYVVDAEGKVYDHRSRYFIPPGYAKRLGKINPRFAVTLWNNRKGQIADVLK